MVHSGFRGIGNLSFSDQFLKKWHRLASTASGRKVAKIQHDISWFKQKKIFSKHQNKVEFKNLDDSLDLNSDFPGLRTSTVSMTSTASMTSVASMTSTASIHQKFHWSWWLDHPRHPICTKCLPVTPRFLVLCLLIGRFLVRSPWCNRVVIACFYYEKQICFI